MITLGLAIVRVILDTIGQRFTEVFEYLTHHRAGSNSNGFTFLQLGGIVMGPVISSDTRAVRIPADEIACDRDSDCDSDPLLTNSHRKSEGTDVRIDD